MRYHLRGVLVQVRVVQVVAFDVKNRFFYGHSVEGSKVETLRHSLEDKQRRKRSMSYV